MAVGDVFNNVNNARHYLVAVFHCEKWDYLSSFNSYLFQFLVEACTGEVEPFLDDFIDTGFIVLPLLAELVSDIPNNIGC